MTLAAPFEACRVRHGDTPAGHLINVEHAPAEAPMPPELYDDLAGRVAFAIANWTSPERAGRRIIRVDVPCFKPDWMFPRRWEIESVETS